MNERLKQIESLTNEITVDLAKIINRTVKTCLYCEHFNEKGETCSKFSKRPPARIIAFGCKDFQESVPF